MSIEKQELLNSIESLPEELASQVLDYMEIGRASCRERV